MTKSIIMFPTQARGRRLSQAEPPALGLTILASFGGLSFALLQGWPLWVLGGGTVIPWLPLFARDVVRTYQAYQWLALFYVLVVTQTAHFLEHVAQMIQIHTLGLTGADARGLFGSLDIEWVHFGWNTWVLVAVAGLLWRLGANRWLWLTALLSGWHELEDAYILFVYLTTGMSGTPGLLSQGGAIAGGVALSRPDLHFLYNLVETVPLVVVFLHQVKSSAPHGSPTLAWGRLVGASRARVFRRFAIVLQALAEPVDHAGNVASAHVTPSASAG